MDDRQSLAFFGLSTDDVADVASHAIQSFLFETDTHDGGEYRPNFARNSQLILWRRDATIAKLAKELAGERDSYRFQKCMN